MRFLQGWLVRSLILVACLAALAFTIGSLGPSRVMGALSGADPRWVLYSALAMVARYAVWTVKWAIMLARRGEVGIAWVARSLLAGVFVNLTTPTAKLAGGFVRAALVRRKTGWGMAESYGWSLADQVTNTLGNIALGGVLLLGAVRVLPPGTVRGPFLALGIVSLAGVAATLLLRGWAWKQVRRPAAARWLARVTPARSRIQGPDGPAAGWVEPVFSPLLEVGKTGRVATVDVGLAALSCSFLCVSNACALAAVGVDASLVLSGAATVLAGFVGTVAGTVGGIGATELALIGLYDQMGLPPESAAAAALLHRAAYYAVSLALGGAALLWEGRKMAPRS